MPKLILIDEYFKNRMGHYYEYNKSVKEIFDAAGYETRIYANIELNADVQTELNAVPFFGSLSKNSLNKIPVLGQLINRLKFWRQMRKKIEELYAVENDPDTIFFFTTVVWYNVLPVAQAASVSKRKNILLYRLSIYEHAGLPNTLWPMGDWLYKYTFKKLLKNPSVRFCTDSDVIAEECNTAYHCNMQTLPIPHIKDDYSNMPPKTGSHEKFVLYAPGAIRDEKGIDFIVNACKYISANNKALLDKITLVTQYNENVDINYNNRVKDALSQLPLENIFLSSLSTEDYHQCLFNADIILIPYSINHGYRARTSGIMSETIAACKPFITTKNSWMELQGIKYGTGVSVTYGDCAEFMHAIETLIEKYPDFSKAAANAKPKWLQFHSKENFRSLFSQLIS